MNILTISSILLFGITNFYNCNGEERNYFFYTEEKDGKVMVGANDTQLNAVDKPGWRAQAYYNASQNLTGWDILELWSNSDYDDKIQAYHAGYLEGYITRQQIWNYYWNNIEQIMTGKTNFTKSVKDSLKKYHDKNLNYITSMIQRHSDTDSYWYQVDLIYKQMYGILDGYNQATKDAKLDSQNLTLNEFLYVTFIQDMFIITQAENYTANNTAKHPTESSAKNESIHEIGKTRDTLHCSALIKLLPGNTDVLIAHNTWSTYSQMNRILKRYKLPFRVSKNSTDIIPGMMTTFSSYPGNVASMDDYYVINSGIVALETTNDIFNESLFQYVTPGNEVIEEVRNIVANRLATNGSTWQAYFQKENSGTYNNQWMIIDLNRFTPGFNPMDGFLTIIEQIPGLIVGEDQTNHLLQFGYWASYNAPFYSVISERSGNKLKGEKNPWFSYDECPRCKIFKRDQSKVVDLNSMISLIRSNNYQTDPYSICHDCDPEPNSCDAIASRCDLLSISGKYNSDESPGLFGAIDAKVTSYSLFIKGELVAVGGPTHNDHIPPLDWNKADTKFNHSMRHLGQPIVWDFEPILTTWMLPYSVKSNDTNRPAEPLPNNNDKNNKGSSVMLQPLSLIAYLSIVLIIVIKA